MSSYSEKKVINEVFIEHYLQINGNLILQFI